MDDTQKIDLKARGVTEALPVLDRLLQDVQDHALYEAERGGWNQVAAANRPPAHQAS